MVRTKQPSEYETLEAILQAICDEHGYKLYVAGWTRKTFDIFQENRAERRSQHVIRVESLATSNGEVHYFDDHVEELATEIASALEDAFPIAEGVIVKGRRPEY